MIPQHLKWLVLLAALAGSLTPTTVLAAEPVGKVLISLGANQALSSDGQSRKLRRNTPVFAGDRILTAERGRVQLRFSDGSLVAVQADSEFVVEQYAFDPEHPNDGEAVYRLVQGGMRTLTGLIGREEKEDYRVETPVATIGIRGTLYGLYFCNAGCAARTGQQQGLFGSVVRGGIQVNNSAGASQLGVDEHFYVGSREAPLQPLLAPPELLVELPPVESEDAEQAAESGANGAEPDTEDTAEEATQESSDSDGDTSSEAQAQPDGESAPEAEGEGGTDADSATGDTPSNATAAADSPNAEAGDAGSEGRALAPPLTFTGTGDEALPAFGTEEPVLPALGFDADPTSEADSDQVTQTAQNDTATDTSGGTATDSGTGGDTTGGTTTDSGAGGDSSGGTTTDSGTGGDSSGGTTTDSGTGGDSTGGTTTDSGSGGDTSVAAPAGAVLAIGSIKLDTLGPHGGGGALVVDAGNTLQLDTIEGAGNVPVAFSLIDPQLMDGEMGCNPCAFDAGSAVLAEAGGLSGAGLGINWGRWRGGWTLLVNGVAESMGEDLHFIYSPNRISEAAFNALTGTFSYRLAGGTEPSDELGNLGQYTAGLGSIQIDLSNRLLLGLDFQVEYPSLGKQVSAHLLHSLVPFDRNLLDHGVALRGFCLGGNCGTGGLPLMGEISLDFVGENAERMISSWGLFEENFTSSVAFTGVAAFEQDAPLAAGSFSFAPPGTRVSLAYIANDGPGSSLAWVLPLEAEFDTAIVKGTIDGVGNVPVYTSFFDPSGARHEISAGNAVLVDDGGLSTLGVNWGRWNGDWAHTSDVPEPQLQADSLHFIHSGSRTPDFVVQSLTGSFAYTLAGGTAPTNEFGVAGSYTGTNQIDVDFSSQSLTGVQLTMAVDGRSYSASQATPMALGDLISGAPVALSGSCSAGSCGVGVGLAGKMALDFVGPNAEALIGSFGLQGDGTSPGVAVSGAAAFTR